jgi:hypothetical protein
MKGNGVVVDERPRTAEATEDESTAQFLAGRVPTQQPDAPRNEQIRRLCTERGIASLLHFTRVDNLASVLRHGLAGREALAARRIAFVANDALRLDACPDAVSLSVGFPNYKLLYLYRMRDAHAQWVILILKPDILWTLDCAFCKSNAAHHTVTSVALDIRRTTEAFQSMFEDAGISRSGLEIPPQYPTNPQAEILALEPIDPHYITDVHFSHKDVMSEWLAGQTSYIAQRVAVSTVYFSPRLDYVAWRPVGAPDQYDDTY